MQPLLAFFLTIPCGFPLTILYVDISTVWFLRRISFSIVYRQMHKTEWSYQNYRFPVTTSVTPCPLADWSSLISSCSANGVTQRTENKVCTSLAAHKQYWPKVKLCRAVSIWQLVLVAKLRKETPPHFSKDLAVGNLDFLSIHRDKWLSSKFVHFTVEISVHVFCRECCSPLHIKRPSAVFSSWNSNVIQCD